MAQKMNKEAKKLITGFTGVLLEKFADLRFSPAERRSFLDAAWDLWIRYPKPKRYLEILEQLFDESQEPPNSPFKIGRYIRERLKDKRPL